MPMPPHPHDPNCMSPGFPGAPTMNGQRLYMSPPPAPPPAPPQGNVGPRMSPRGAPPGFASFSYFPLGPPDSAGPSGVAAAAAMCSPTAPVPGAFSASPPGAPALLPADQQGAIARKNDTPSTSTAANSTTTKKKRAKATKVGSSFHHLTFHFFFYLQIVDSHCIIYQAKRRHPSAFNCFILYTKIAIFSCFFFMVKILRPKFFTCARNQGGRGRGGRSCFSRKKDR